MLSHDDLIKKMLENPNVKAEYDALENEFALLTEMIKARRAAGLSQQEVAQRYAHTIGCHLDIKFIPNSKNP